MAAVKRYSKENQQSNLYLGHDHRSEYRTLSSTIASITRKIEYIPEA